MTFAEAVAALNGRTNYEATGAGLVAPTLDRARGLAELLDHPQRLYPSIHVTGTNGKGSVVVAAATLLEELGLATGTYTSPHLHSVRERIAYGLYPIQEQDFADTYAYLEPFLETIDRQGSPATWFEAITAMSWIYFSDKVVDAAVFEVGMGGTWDATNLIDARVCVITKIALDHKELGDTTAEVARDKSGIIAPESICLTGERDPDIVEIIRQRCDEQGAQLRVLGGDMLSIERRKLALGGQALDIRVGDHLYDELFIPWFGEGLADNAALALGAVAAFLGDRRLDDELVRAALAAVRHPGRTEVLGRRPLIVADGAHNADAAASLAAAMRESFQWDSLRLVIGMMQDHFRPGVLASLLPLADEIIVTQPSGLRAMPASLLADEVAAFERVCRVAQTVDEACELAMSHAQEGDAVLITGSLYTVASARDVLGATVEDARRERQHRQSEQDLSDAADRKSAEEDEDPELQRVYDDEGNLLL